MKIAWGITGAGHYLRQSVELIEAICKKPIQMDLFLSAAGESLLKMYGLLSRLEELQRNEPKKIGNIFKDNNQAPGFPICGKFNLHHYDLLVLSPLSANSVAKINVGIADNLITNIFAQMIKGGGKILVLPCDIIAGEITTEIPSGEKIKIHVDEFNSSNARTVAKFPHVSVFETPSALFKVIQTQYLS